MADTLLFRKGLLANLPEAYTPGAFSVTTDEPGLYLDTATKRIRISDLKVFADIDAFSTWATAEGSKVSPNALYLAEKENAILKYNSTTGQVVHLNDQSALIESIAQVNKDLASLVTRVTAVEGKVKTLEETTIPSIAERIDGIDDNIESIIGEANSSVNGTTIKSLKDLTTAISTMASDETVKDLKDAVDSHSAQITSLQSKVDVGEDTVSGAIAKALTEAKEYADTAEADANAYTDDKITAVNSSIVAETARAEAAEKANADAIASVSSNLTSVGSRVSALETSVGTKGEDAGVDATNLWNAVSELSSDIAAGDANIKAIIGGTYSDAATVAADIASVRGIAETLRDTTVPNLSSKVTSLEGLVGNTSVSTQIDEKITALNLETTYKTIASAEADHKAIEDKLGSKSSTGTDLTSTTAWSAIEELEDKLSSANTDASGVSAKVTALESQMETANSNISGIQEKLIGIDGTVKEAIDAVNTSLTNSIQATNGEVESLSTKLTEEITRAKAAEAKNAEDISAIKNGSSINDFAAVESKIAEINTAAEAYATKVELNAKAVELLGADGDAATKNTIYGAQAAAANAYSAAQAASEKVDTKVGTLTGAINGSDVSGDTATVYATNAANTAYEAAKDYADSLLEASEAMIFKGEVASADALDAIEGKQSGDTYVVSAAFGDYKPGDLLVWPVDGDISSWVHVKTGYDANNNPALDVDTSSENTVSVALKGLGNTQLGEAFTLNADTTTNVTLTHSDGGATTIGMVWGSF